MISMIDGGGGSLGSGRARSAPEWTPELGAMLVAVLVLVALAF